MPCASIGARSKTAGRKIRHRLAIAGLLAAWIALGLFGHDPWKPDEAYTFGVVYEALKKGDWLVPTLAGRPFMEKPPLFFWTAAGLAKAFGLVLALPDAARLASGFYVGLALFFTWLAAGRRVAAPLLLAGCLGFLQHAHQLVTDNALIAGVAIGLYGLRASRGFVLGTGAGIAFLSKGLLGPGVLGLTALLLPAFPAWRGSWRQWGWAAAAFVPWALIWPWLLYRHSPALFDEWLWVNNFGRFTGAAQLGGALDHWQYARALVWFALPAWPLALWTLLRRPFVPEVQLACLSFAVTFAVLSISASARTLYGLPLLVPLAMIASLDADSAPRWLALSLERGALWVAGLAGVLLWVAWVAFLAGWRPVLLEQLSPGFAPRFEALAVAAAAAVTGLCLYSLSVEPRLPGRWLAALTLPWGLSMTLWISWLDYAKTYRGVAEDMRAHWPPVAGCVASCGLGEPQRAMFEYFGGLVTVPAPNASCPLLLVETSSPDMPGDGTRLTLAWRGRRPGDTKEWFWLFQRVDGSGSATDRFARR